LNLSIHEYWVFIKNPIKLGPSTIPIDHGSWRPTHSPWVRSHDQSSTCRQPKVRGQGPRVRWGVPIPKAEPKCHVCVGCAQAPGRSQAPHVPTLFFFDNNNNFLNLLMMIIIILMVIFNFTFQIKYLIVFNIKNNFFLLW
jgi:hypothetical protein